MSSHREAPEISKDPAADSTDVYAFVSPDKASTVTLIANFIPLQQPNGGPNFYEFSDDVLYEIHVSNDGKPTADITYQFRFTTRIRNKNSFLYNTGRITSISDPAWNRPQYYSITRIKDGKKRVLGSNLPCPPVNVGPRSTPNYEQLATQAVRFLPGGKRVFAGQRADAFHVDLGSVFDLGALRPFNEAHVIPLNQMDGINSVQAYNVHTLALQIPMTELTSNGRRPTNVMDSKSTIGVWATASRQKSRVFDRKQAKYRGVGPWKQISRLGNPLFNEVIVPMAKKDAWNIRKPGSDKFFQQYVYRPELAALLPDLYPGVFPKLKAYNKDRADLHAILLTGIPAGVIEGFQNYTGAAPADMLRLNMAVPPSEDPDPRGLAYGDAAGFPNGRRIIDDVVTIELRAIAGLTIPLVDPTYTPDDAAGAVTDGTSDTNAPLLNKFPYLGHPGGGYQTVPGTTTFEDPPETP